MPIPIQGGPVAGPSTFDKLKLGAMMGTSVGLCIGFIFGSYNIIKHGPGPNGMMRSLGQYMAGSAATFGFFMSVGTVIRTSSNDSNTIMDFETAIRRQRGKILVLGQDDKTRWTRVGLRREAWSSDWKA